MKFPPPKMFRSKSRKASLSGFWGRTAPEKTTVLKMLAGLLVPTSGTARVLDYIPWERKAPFKRQFSLVLGQKNSLWWDLPAHESLELNRAIYEIEERKFRKIVDELVDLLDVRDKLNVMVRELSLGERMKMELIVALIHSPKILFLDEPTIGLDVVSQKKVRDFLRHYSEGKSDFHGADEPLHAGYRRTLQTGDHHRSRTGVL